MVAKKCPKSILLLIMEASQSTCIKNIDVAISAGAIAHALIIKGARQVRPLTSNLRVKLWLVGLIHLPRLFWIN